MPASTAAKFKDLPSMTLEEFLSWDGDGHVGKLELVEGKVRAMAPASATHSLIQGNILAAIKSHLRLRNSRCRAAPEAPIVPPLGRRKNARAPDVAVSSAPVSDSPTFDDPVLIAEVLSPSNEDETWESIEALAGLKTMQEVLVVQSTRVEAEVLRRDERGYWSRQGDIVRQGGTVRLASIDLDLPISAVYEGTHLA